MKAHIQASRALAAGIVKPYIKTASFIAGAAVVGASLLIWWLADEFGAWWWLLMIVVGLVGLVAAVALGLGWLALRLVQPDLTKLQRRAVGEFLDKTKNLNDVVHTPYPLLILKIVVDLILHRDGRYVRGIMSDSASLKSDYMAITRYFDN